MAQIKNKKKYPLITPKDKDFLVATQESTGKTRSISVGDLSQHIIDKIPNSGGDAPIKDIKFKGESLPVVDKSVEIPSKLSEFENDLDIIEEGKIDNISFKGEDLKIEEKRVVLPSDLSEFTDGNEIIPDVSDFVNEGKVQEKIEEWSIRNVSTIAELRTIKGEVGQKINLLGYYSAGDKQSLLYEWVEEVGEDDEGSIIVVSSGYWKALFVNCVDILDFGVLPSNEDRKKEIQNVFDVAKRLNMSKVTVSKSGIYTIKSHVDDFKGNYLSNQGGLSLHSNSEYVFNKDVFFKVMPTSEGAYVCFRAYEKENITINGLNVIGDRKEHLGTNGEWGYGIALTASKNIKIKDSSIIDCWGDGINIQVRHSDRMPNYDIEIRSVTCDNNRRQGMSIEGVVRMLVIDSVFSNTNGTAPECGIDIEPWDPKNKAEHIRIERCVFNNNDGGGMLVMQEGVNNVYVDRCLFVDNKNYEGQFKTSSSISSLYIINNIFTCTKELNNPGGVSLVNGKNIVFKGNTITNGTLRFLNTLKNTLKDSSYLIEDNTINVTEEYKIPFDVITTHTTTADTVNLVFKGNVINCTGVDYTSKVIEGRVILHGLTDNSLIKENKFINLKGGVQIRGKNVIVENNIINETDTASSTIQGDNIVFRNNIIKGSCYGNSGGYAVKVLGNKNIIKNNTFNHFSDLKNKTTNYFPVVIMSNLNTNNDISENICEGRYIVRNVDINEKNRIVNEGVFKKECLLPEVGDIDKDYRLCVSRSKTDTEGNITTQAVWHNIVKE